MKKAVSQIVSAGPLFVLVSTPGGNDAATVPTGLKSNTAIDHALFGCRALLSFVRRHFPDSFGGRIPPKYAPFQTPGRLIVTAA